VVPLQSLDPIYVNFGVPQQEVATLKVGAVVNVLVEGADSVAATGKVTAVNSVIDPATRNVEVQASFRNPGRQLRPGMFVEVSLVGNETNQVIALPASAINYAPYGDSVFIVEDVTGPDGSTYKGVRQQFVKLGGGRGDQVAVLSGVKAGEEIVSSGVFKLRPGAAVEVNNSVTPTNDPAPKPEDS
jgi:membrane fusion protein (multidrug efflux system)